jgi:hypothetical protein
VTSNNAQTKIPIVDQWSWQISPPVLESNSLPKKSLMPVFSNWFVMEFAALTIHSFWTHFVSWMLF